MMMSAHSRLARDMATRQATIQDQSSDRQCDRQYLIWLLSNKGRGILVGALAAVAGALRSHRGAF